MKSNIEKNGVVTKIKKIKEMREHRQIVYFGSLLTNDGGFNECIKATMRQKSPSREKKKFITEKLNVSQ